MSSAAAPGKVKMINNAFGDQKPFREKVSGLPKAFNYKKFLGVLGPFFKKEVVNPNPFTVSQTPFFRSLISKVCRKNKVSEGISKKVLTHRSQNAGKYKLKIWRYHET
jgi:hypothetical protein